MALESPVAIAIIGRMGDKTVNAAGFLMLMAVSIFIESPVIDLLTTSTTLAKKRQDYLAIRRFALILIVGVTAIHALVALTPAFSWLAQNVLRLPEPVIEVMRPALIVMIPWSACIGWRRYLQGILIRNGMTKQVGWGTFLRVGTISIVGFSLYQFAKLPSLIIVAIALIASVFAEAALMHVLSRRVIEAQFPKATPEETFTDASSFEASEGLDRPTMPQEVQPEAGQPVTLASLVRFHYPLTLATMVMMTATPSIGSALARLPAPVETMAAWQICTTLLFITRSVTFSLPEVVITLYKDSDSLARLRSFGVRVGLILSCLIVVFWALGIWQFLFQRLLNAEPDDAARASQAMIACAPLPFFSALVSLYRGMLTAKKATLPRLLSILFGVAALILVLTLGIASKGTGIYIAAAALFFGIAVEYLTLRVSWTMLTRKLAVQKAAA